MLTGAITRRRFALLLGCTAGLLWASAGGHLLQAQDPGLAPKPVGVRITFLPPPQEGTISLGVFDSAGKLIRVLHRETQPEELTVGLNGLITEWDGKNDAGVEVPPGKYQVRGYAVGAITVEGVAYHGNEWITEEAGPRIASIEKVILSEKGFSLQAKDAAGELAWYKGELSTGAIQRLPKGDPAPAPDGTDTGGASTWKIAEDEDGTKIVQQIGPSGEVLRALKPDPDGFTPVHVTAAAADQMIAILERSQDAERLRVLKLEGKEASKAEGGIPVSNWRTVLSRTIRNAPDFKAAVGFIESARKLKPENPLATRLVPNPLQKNARNTLNLRVAITASGSELQSPDGLPLTQMTETPALRWVATGRDSAGKTALLFQSDGTVIEEYRLRNLGHIMAFDAGQYAWKTRPPAPEEPAEAAPEPTADKKP